ncbi:MAG: replicative DNA helicase [Candidatus Comchoanobacterales bacterium]
MAQQQLKPISREAERAVLGGVILDNQRWDDVAELLVQSDFFVMEHRYVFESIAYLSEQAMPFDTITVNETLKKKGFLEKMGGEQFLFELVNETPVAANILSYAKIVHEKSHLRSLMEAGQYITDLAHTSGSKNADELINEAEQKIMSIKDTRSSSDGPRSIQDILTETTDKIDRLSQMEGTITGSPTGFDDLDKMTSGLHPGDLVIVAGRPSMGKTVFGVNIAEHVAISAEKPVLIFSLEMPSDSIVMRMMSSLGRINQHQVRTGNLSDEDWPRLSSAVSMIKNAKIFIDDQPGVSPIDIRSRARRIKRQHPDLGLILVDYLQLMRIPGFKEGRTLEISEISRTLKLIAKEMNVPVIALSQLNRSLEQRPDKRPVMSDLRESGSIEQDADLIAFIYRDEVYNEDSPDKGVAEIIIAKQRNGPIGKVKLTFLGQYTRFENHAHFEASFG